MPNQFVWLYCEIRFFIIWIPYLFLIYRAAETAKQGSVLGKKLTTICMIIFMITGVIGIFLMDQPVVQVMVWKAILNLVAGALLLYYLSSWESGKYHRKIDYYDDKDQSLK